MRGGSHPGRTRREGYRGQDHSRMNFPSGFGALRTGITMSRTALPEQNCPGGAVELSQGASPGILPSVRSNAAVAHWAV